MKKFFKKHTLLLMCIVVLSTIFLVGMIGTKKELDKSYEEEVLVYESCEEYRETGVYIDKRFTGNPKMQEYVGNTAHIDYMCEITKDLKDKPYNFISLYLNSIDGSSIDIILTFLTPLLLMILTSYYIDEFLKDNKKYELKDIYKNGYKSLLLIPLFIIVTIIISLVASDFRILEGEITADFSSSVSEMYMYVMSLLVFVNFSMMYKARIKNYVLSSVVSYIMLVGIWYIIGIYLGVYLPISYQKEELLLNVLITVSYIITFIIIAKVYKPKKNTKKKK